MKFSETGLDGHVVIEAERIADERGWFQRTFDAAEFVAHGLDATVVHCSSSFTEQAGTLRGLHLQRAPFAETKLVRCVSGHAWDVAVDLRPDSPTFGRWRAVDLVGGSGRSVFIPRGFAHGFVTLAPATELAYQMSEVHHPESAIGVRWDDPDLAIEWPVEPTLLSERDRSLPSLVELSDALVGAQ